MAPDEDSKPDLDLPAPQSMPAVALTTSVSSPLPTSRQPILSGAYASDPPPTRQTQSSPFATRKRSSALLKDRLPLARPQTPATRKRKREPDHRSKAAEAMDEMGRLAGSGWH
jgi:hypothetical protein